MLRKTTLALAALAALRPVSFDDPPKIPDELKDVVEGMINAAKEEAVSGLKSKNNQLLGEVRELKDKVKAFDGLDPVAIKALMDKIGNDEEAQLIAKGKIDEVLAKRTERLQADFNKKLEKAQQDQQKLVERNQALVKRATSAAILEAATKSGALATAMDDINLRAQSAGWTVDDEGNVIAKKGDDVILGKDAKTPLSPSEWLESTRESAPHLWPAAQGSGANGSNTPRQGQGVDMSKLKPEDRMTLARQQAAQSRH